MHDTLPAMMRFIAQNSLCLMAFCNYSKTEKKPNLKISESSIKIFSMPQVKYIYSSEGSVN